VERRLQPAAAESVSRGRSSHRLRSSRFRLIVAELIRSS
jgi:hypothetical protein